MSRSRSSFDIKGAIATAASLTSPEEAAVVPYRGVPLVSFAGAAAPAPAHASAMVPPAPAPPSGSLGTPPSYRDSMTPTPRAGPVSETPSFEDSVISEPTRRPPKLPDLSNITSPLLRCHKIVDWITEATGAVDVFIADAAGLPLAGATEEAEARLASAGLVASSVTQLAAAIPGAASTLFEMHVGEGPFFQLVGFHVDNALYLVGWSRPTPLSYRQAHAIRLACRHALGEASVGGSS